MAKKLLTKNKKKTVVLKKKIETIKKKSIGRIESPKRKKRVIIKIEPINFTQPKESENKLVETRPAKKTPRVKRGTGGIMYFTQDTENAIVAYNKTDSLAEKNVIYNEKIRYPFNKIAENIFNTFKFSYNEVSPIKVQEEAVSHMVANIGKYDQCKGKAFGYFSIIAKHWFILENNNNYRRFKKHTSISEQPGDVGEFVVEPEHHKKENETKEFIKLMVTYWDKHVGGLFNKPSDLKIANAIIELFRNSDRIDVFNKKALYLYIREICGCETQSITKIASKFKETQRAIYEEYLATGTIVI
jgi:hypothetical protein